MKTAQRQALIPEADIERLQEVAGKVGTELHSLRTINRELLAALELLQAGKIGPGHHLVEDAIAKGKP